MQIQCTLEYAYICYVCALGINILKLLALFALFMFICALYSVNGWRLRAIKVYIRLDYLWLSASGNFECEKETIK